MKPIIENPMKLDGIEFLEFAGDFTQLSQCFKKLGFIQFKLNDEVALFLQGNIKFIINLKDAYANDYAALHGPSICGVGLRVQNADYALKRALQLGAKSAIGLKGKESHLQAIESVGQSFLYFVDQANRPVWLQENTSITSNLDHIDHLAINVYRGNLQKTIHFFEHLFNFKELKSYDIHGKHTSFKTYAMISPCGKIRLPINESLDDKSQIEEFLNQYQGEGIQHVAFAAKDICKAVFQLRQKGVRFMDIPDTYYEMIDNRLPNHQQNIEMLKAANVLIDGDASTIKNLILQIFTDRLLGPIFFELIERKGGQGFGGGNITALFESMERDQIRRGVLVA